MIKIKEYTPRDVDELKKDISERLEHLKENGDDESIEKINSFLDIG